MFQSDRDAFIAFLSLVGQPVKSINTRSHGVESVSRETHFSVTNQAEVLAKLDRYAELLREWNTKFNLVSESTLPKIWSRHFLDSAQLLRFIPSSTQTLIDLGSGAGFPGLVLSILGIQNVHLVESTGKKVTFLRTVIDELKLNTTVHHERIESLSGIKAEVVTARALGHLRELFKLARKLLEKDGVCLFLKGKSAADELTESQKYWRFSCTKMASISDPSGTVLAITNLQPHDPRSTIRRRHGN